MIILLIIKYSILKLIDNCVLTSHGNKKKNKNDAFYMQYFPKNLQIYIHLF